MAYENTVPRQYPWSRVTRNAIIRFQLGHEQVATGDLDEETQRRLGLPPPLRH